MSPFRQCSEKRCFKCGAVKPIGEFYPHKSMADGHLNKCKECNKIDTKQRYRDHHDKVRAYDKKRNEDPARKAKRLAYQKATRGRNPEKYRARVAVSNAIRDGSLSRMPCKICGSSKSEAHHRDYSKPLEVEWLCMVHHRQAHDALIENYPVDSAGNTKTI